jgi:hypothetical protein
MALTIWGITSYEYCGNCLSHNLSDVPSIGFISIGSEDDFG